MSSIDHIVFDLGGVLIDWDGVSPLVELTENRLNTEEARKYWFESPWISKFERNQCTSHEFAIGIVNELDLNMTPDEFVKEFISWNKGFQDGAKEILGQLSSKYTLSCLTNNNPLYIGDLIDNHGLEKYFDHLFISYQTGQLKPSLQAFVYVVEKLNCKPETILFFDDNVECVQAASKVGLQSYQVNGFNQVTEILKNLHLIG